MKSPHQLRIEAFMRRAEELSPGMQQVAEIPSIPSVEVRELRCRLILEEALETIAALGFGVVINETGGGEQTAHIDRDVKFVESFEPDLVEIADGCADLSVVTIGTLSSCGLPDIPFLEAVDENNLRKFGPGAWVNDHGKLMKPTGFVKVDLRKVIEYCSREPSGNHPRH